MPSKSSTLRAITGDKGAAKGPVAAVPDAPQASIEAATLVGVRAPTDRGGTPRFLTEVIVELGLPRASRSSQRSRPPRVSGETPEAMLFETARSAPMASRSRARGTLRPGLRRPSAFNIDMAAANLVSSQVAKRYDALPIAILDDRTLLVAMSDPANVLAVDDIAILTGFEVRAAVATS